PAATARRRSPRSGSRSRREVDPAQPAAKVLQLSSLGNVADPAVAQAVRAWLQKAANDPQIESLTLTDVARIDSNNVVTLRTAELDLVDDYFSGFASVFVGFLGLQGSVPDPYGAGILDPSVRWRNIHGAREALGLFHNRYPHLSFHYYLDYEANLNDFVQADLREAHLAMNLALINDFRAIRPDGVTLWSPTFWTPHSQVADLSALQGALTTYFSRLKEGTNGVGVQWLDFQDFVGQSYSRSSPMTYQDVKNYHTLLAQSHAFTHLRVNLEYFQQAPNGALAPMPGFELASRQAFYAENNLSLGMSWEMRWWYQSEGQW
ncbi:MAG: hypothetical protein JXB05_37820, partial [Myxococcaceae bacterium]|nr:hypothetical protein [Myxococcaceae bacterium]